MIGRKNKERLKLQEEIDALETKSKPKPTLDTEPTNEIVGTKEGIRKLIEIGKIELAIKSTLDSFPSSEITLLSGRFNRINSQQNGGTISNEAYSIEMNRVTNSLLAILND